jgi:hypothetical protein
MDYVRALQKIKFNIAVARTLSDMVNYPINNDIDGQLRIDAFIQNNNQAMAEMVRLGRLVGILDSMGKTFLRRAVDKNKALLGFGKINETDQVEDPLVKRWLAFQEEAKTHGDVWAFFETENLISICALDNHPHQELSLSQEVNTMFGCLKEPH